MTRIILTYGDVTTDLRTTDALTAEGVETFARIAYEQHTQAISYAAIVEAQP